MSNIKNIFAAWGKSQHQTPVRNEVLKSTILNHMPELSGGTAKLRLPWLSFAFAGLAVVMIFIRPFVSSPTEDRTISSQSIGYAEPMSDESLTKNTSMKAPDYYPYYNDAPPISDDREFFKMTYNAEIRARNPGEMTKRAQTIIHAFDGRVDYMSSANKYGQITFVLPAEKFDAFQVEIQALTGGKLIAENISAQNLLPEVRRLEAQKKDPAKVLENAETVQGTINLRWISIPEIIALYAGPYWITILLGVLALVTFIINRVRTSRIVLPA